jgi:TonB family protein
MVNAMNIAAIRSDWVGRVVDGRFTLLDWLGGSDRSGDFVTELPDDRTHKTVIKLIAVDADAEAQIAGWAAAAGLSHPHLMRPIHTGQGQIDGVAVNYVVTEYAEEVLSQILLERPLTPTEAREMLDPVLDALDFLHGKGFVHGHVKPSNILVVDGQLKLSGDCIHVAGEPWKHASAGVYDAPECDGGPIAAAADMWSLGMTLAEVLTQQLPVWDRAANEDPVLPESIPQPFANIAQECLRRDAARRCSIRESRARLKPVELIPKSASETSKAAPAKSLASMILAAVLVVIVVIAIAEWRSHRVAPSTPSGSQQPAPASAAPTPQTSTAATQPEARQAAKGGTGKGEVAERVMPEVLPSASASITGKISVKIRVAVDASGEVSNATFDRHGPSNYFAKVAMQAAQQWKFKPAQVNGQAASSAWVLDFQFRRSGTEVAAEELTR